MPDNEKLERSEGFDADDPLRRLLVAAGDLVYEWDLTSNRISWSDNASAVLGLGDSGPLDSARAFQERINVTDLPLRSAALLRHFEGEPALVCVYRLRGGDGAVVRVEERAVAALDAERQPRHLVGALRVIESEDAGGLAGGIQTPGSETRPPTLSLGLGRALLRESLAETLAFVRRFNGSGAYLAVSIDSLDLINRSHGHDAGDQAIQVVGRRLEAIVRASDTVCRLGGSRFGVILANCSDEDLPAAAEKILAAVRSEPVTVEGASIPVTVSIGAVALPSMARNIDEAMEKAEDALKAARRAGRDCFLAYQLNHLEHASRKETMVRAEQVLSALKTNRLRLAYQPIVSVAGGRVLSYECLLRMEDGNGIESAGQFLPLVEQLGLIGLVDRRTLELTFEVLARRRDVSLALNISGHTVTDESWLRALEGFTAADGTAAERLTIEITETAGLHDIDDSARFVARLHELGCRVSLDDFGAGYTSFQHLDALAPDVVKIDGSFVRGLSGDGRKRLFVESLLKLAQGIGCETVAECVENRADAEVMQRFGVDHLQGHYLGRPTLELPRRGQVVVRLGALPSRDAAAS